MKSVHLNQHIPELDGLRGVAALIVIISHSANAGLLPKYLGHGFGQQGVALFFLLSSYLIAKLYLEKDVTRDNLFNYAIARVARVLPLFYLVVISSAILWLLIGVSFYGFDNFEELYANIFLVSGTTVLWSIPVEIQYYLTFVILWCGRARGLMYVSISILFIFQVLILIFGTFGPYTIVSWFHFFIIGTLIASRDRLGLTPKYLVYLSLFFLPFALPEVRRSLGFVVLENYFDPITAGYPVLIFYFVVSRPDLFSVLATPIMRYLGQVSFGMYLLHWPILIVVSYVGLNEYISLVAVFSVTFFASSLSLYLIEKPSQRFLKSKFIIG